MSDKKTSKKNRKYNILLVTIIFVVGILTIPMTFFHLSGFFIFPTPPVPENTYGEFPFRIVYAIKDELFTIEDVLIIEYAGRNKESYTGRDIKFLGSLASDSKVSRGYEDYIAGRGFVRINSFSITIRENVDSGQGTIGQLKIDIGSAEYYLGYYLLGDYRPGLAKDGYGVVDKDTLRKQYNVTIIEASFSEPLLGNGIDMTPIE